MPLSGGVPTRRTFESEGAEVVGWTPDGRLLYTPPAVSGIGTGSELQGTELLKTFTSPGNSLPVPIPLPIILPHIQP